MQHSFRAMGTTITLIGPVDSDPEAFAEAARDTEAIFEDQEQRFSRFRSDSELSKVNASAGGRIKVSADLAEVTRLALDAAARTGGLFDPTTLPALLAAGYDRDIDDVRREPRILPLADAPPCGRHAEVALEGQHLHLPEGVALDFGGIAKGWTADRAAEHAVGLLPWASVNAGGDVRVAGLLPAEGLKIGVEDPAGSDHVLEVALRSGALATSSVIKRSWGPGLHHLIDPRTARPAATSFVQVTAWASTCAEAEVFAKWALLGGNGVLDEVSAVGVLDGGDIVMNLEAA
jgi:FAD:protein FMN transferase